MNEGSGLVSRFRISCRISISLRTFFTQAPERKRDATLRSRYPDAKLRNGKNIISSISVADIIFDEYLGKWNYRAILKVKT